MMLKTLKCQCMLFLSNVEVCVVLIMHACDDGREAAGAVHVAAHACMYFGGHACMWHGVEGGHGRGAEKMTPGVESHA